MALRLRSGARVGSPSFTPDEELDYPTILNRALPRDIRVLGWTPVVPTFSARYPTPTLPSLSAHVVLDALDVDDLHVSLEFWSFWFEIMFCILAKK